MGSSKTIYRWEMAQYVVACVVLVMDLLAIFDLASFGSYDWFGDTIGPTVALIMSSDFPLSLCVWCIGALIGVITFGVVLCKHHGWTALLSAIATVCFDAVLFMSLTFVDIDAKLIIGYTPAQFYGAFFVVHLILALVSLHVYLRTSR